MCENNFAHNINSYLLWQLLTKNISNDKKSLSLRAMKEMSGFEAQNKG